MRTARDIGIGQRFGLITTSEETAFGYWYCVCDCGERLTLRPDQVRRATDCGHVRREEAMRRTKGYRMVAPAAVELPPFIPTLRESVSQQMATFNPQPKDPEYRNRALLDLAHREDSECGNCERPGPCEPAHSNMAQHGKAGSHKSHDPFTADLCHDCHAWLDQGIGSDPTGRWSDDRADKQAMWRLAFDRTLLRRWRLGLIKVST